MLEPDIKQKIVNTISRYEKKCGKLQHEINGLRNTLQELTQLPLGIHTELDPQIEQLRSDLDSETNAEVLQIRVNVLIAVLSRCLWAKHSENVLIDTRVNESLNQLLDHLSIPEILKENVEKIKADLETPLLTDKLSPLIDNLTDLVIEAFNLEQNRLKIFLQQMTAQLNDFDQFLGHATVHKNQGEEDSKKLESGIQYNIQQIQNHMDTSKTLADLSQKMGENLEGIAQHIQRFRESEEKRNLEHENQIKMLQEKIVATETSSVEMQNKLSFQSFKINHDGLTGLANRIFYDERLEEAYERWKRGYGNLSLAVADIDHFKLINDTYGHLAGDKVLKKIALIFKSAIRATDFVARYGGEEFVFIFENTQKEEAFVVLEKLRSLIENCNFSYKNHKVNITVSFGVTHMQQKDDLESLFSRADSAMYQAKSSGRNRVINY